jgi:hypothetical protein
MADSEKQNNGDRIESKAVSAGKNKEHKSTTTQKGGINRILKNSHLKKNRKIKGRSS